MTAYEIVARIRTGRGTPLEQLVCHPRLSLIAGLDSERPVVHVWDYRSGHALEVVGVDSAEYDYSVKVSQFGFDKVRHPDVVWHPEVPLLVVATPAGVTQWTPTGQGTLDGIPADAAYHTLMFSPDGRELWAYPPSDDVEESWNWSDVIDVASGTVTPVHRWLLRFAVHPGGGLAATSGDDLLTFARVDEHTTPITMARLQRKAALLATHSEPPVFSPDGRYIAVRSGCNGPILEVFEFPSLTRVLHAGLGEPSPRVFPSPRRYVDRMRAYPRHNSILGHQPGVVWVGTPRGTLIEIDLDSRTLAEHDLPDCTSLTALSRTGTGEIVAATGAGELLLIAVRNGAVEAAATATDSPQALVTAFLKTTSAIPEDDIDPAEHLEFVEEPAGDDTTWWIDGLEAPHRDEPDTTLTDDQRRQVLMESMLATLSETESGIIRLRFGLTDGQPRTDEEIAQVYQLYPQQLRETEAEAHRKLRDANGHLESILATLSDDEAGTIRLRFGLTDGQPRGYEEIAQIYGLDPQQIRENELRAHQQLWDSHSHDELIIQFENRLQP